MVGLKDESDLLIAPSREREVGKAGEVHAVGEDGALVRRVEAAQQMQQRALARAGCAAQGEKFSARHLHADAAKDFQGAPADAVAFVQIAGLHEDGTGGG